MTNDQYMAIFNYSYHYQAGKICEGEGEGEDDLQAVDVENSK
jgi:hypothetical protein